jgi:carbonic anhydrase
MPNIGSVTTTTSPPRSGSSIERGRSGLRRAPGSPAGVPKTSAAGVSSRRDPDRRLASRWRSPTRPATCLGQQDCLERGHAPCKLTRGFLECRSGIFLPKRARFEQVALAQQPRVMMIPRSDSRADPAILTNAKPGDLFIVREVAKPGPAVLGRRRPARHQRALDHAVTALGVDTSSSSARRLRRVHALLTADPAIDAEHPFIRSWLQLADEARRRTLTMARDRPLEVQLRTLEQEPIRTSLAISLASPGSRGGSSRAGRGCTGGFGITTGEVHAFVPEHAAFEPLSLELAARCQGAEPGARRLFATRAR